MRTGGTEFCLATVEGIDLVEHVLMIAGKRRGLNMEAAFGAVINGFGNQHRHHDRNIADRAGHYRQWIELIVLAVPADLFLGEQRLQHIQGFVKFFAAGFQRYAHALHLEAKGAAADADHEPLLGENIGADEFAGEDAHIVQAAIPKPR